MKSDLRFAMAACVIAQLAIGTVLVALSSGPWQLATIAISYFLAILSGMAMLLRWRTAFSVFAGAQMVFQSSSCVLIADLGFAGAWCVLGIGLACLLVGDQALLSSRLYILVSGSQLSSNDVVSATMRSFLRILYFVALVMVCSLLVLFLILAMDVGTLTLPLLLIFGLLIMISLYYLATRGTMAEDGEKPNI